MENADLLSAISISGRLLTRQGNFLEKPKELITYYALFGDLASRRFKTGPPVFEFGTLYHGARAESADHLLTVPLGESKVFISRSCPILVLTTVLHVGRPRRADVKKGVKNYHVPKKAFLSRF